MKQSTQQLKIKLLNIVLNYIYNRDWVNYDNFADHFVDKILEEFRNGNFDLKRVLNKSNATFFRLNNITRDDFLSEEFSERLVDAWRKGISSAFPILTFTDIFPEITSISDNEVLEKAQRLDVPEERITSLMWEMTQKERLQPLGPVLREAPPISQSVKTISIAFFSIISNFLLALLNFFRDFK